MSEFVYNEDDSVKPEPEIVEDVVEAVVEPVVEEVKEVPKKEKKVSKAETLPGKTIVYSTRQARLPALGIELVIGANEVDNSIVAELLELRFVSNKEPKA